MFALACATTLLLALSACALKDPPSRDEIGRQALPGVAVPDAWAGRAAAGTIVEPWLGTFGDPRLAQLVGEAFAYNPDLSLAAARVEEAAANVTAAGGRLGPTIDAFGKGGGKLGGDFTGTSGVLLRATWELDLWGRLRNGRRAAEEAYFATHTDLMAARQSLAGMVAKAWFVAIEAGSSATSRCRSSTDARTGGRARATPPAHRHRQRTGCDARAADAANRARFGEPARSRVP